jgi:hypothetical protein
MLPLSLSILSVQLDQPLKVSLVGGPEGFEILLANGAFGPDGCLRPSYQWLVMNTEPDIRQHACPSTVSVHEWVNHHGSMM